MKIETTDEIRKKYSALQTTLEAEILQEIEITPKLKVDSKDFLSAAMTELTKDRSKNTGNTKGIIELMITNMVEIREYYVISKKQASDAFIFAVLLSMMGFFIIFGAIISFLYVKPDLAVTSITALSGVILEFVAGTALTVYRKTLEQLNIYYNALHQNERFLSAVHLAGKMSSSKRDAAYLVIINAQCKDSGSIQPAADTSGPSGEEEGAAGKNSTVYDSAGSNNNPKPI